MAKSVAAEIQGHPMMVSYQYPYSFQVGCRDVSAVNIVRIVRLWPGGIGLVVNAELPTVVVVTCKTFLPSAVAIVVLGRTARNTLWNVDFAPLLTTWSCECPSVQAEGLVVVQLWCTHWTTAVMCPPALAVQPFQEHDEA